MYSLYMYFAEFAVFNRLIESCSLSELLGNGYKLENSLTLSSFSEDLANLDAEAAANNHRDVVLISVDKDNHATVNDPGISDIHFALLCTILLSVLYK